MKKIYLLLLAAITMVSCSVERHPEYMMDEDAMTKNIDESFPALLKGCYGYLKTWSDPMYRCGEYAGDNIMIRGTSTDAFYEFISYSRTPNNYRLQNFWDFSYKVVAQASNIIKAIPEGKNTTTDTLLCVGRVRVFIGTTHIEVDPTQHCPSSFLRCKYTVFLAMYVLSHQ